LSQAWIGKPFGNDAARVISKDIKNAGEEFETATFAGGMI
jgi:hypothetical protein